MCGTGTNRLFETQLVHFTHCIGKFRNLEVQLYSIKFTLAEYRAGGRNAQRHATANNKYVA